VADFYLTPENSTPAERAAARREMIAEAVADARKQFGNKYANALEKRLFDMAEKAEPSDG